MPSKKDSSPKHKYNLRSNKKNKELNKQYKKNSDSSDEEYESDIEVDIKDYREFLSKIFPSKFMEQRVNETPSKRSRFRNRSITPPHDIKKRKIIHIEKGEENDDENEKQNNQSNINIVFTINDAKTRDEEYVYEENESGESDESESDESDESESENEESQTCNTKKYNEHIKTIRNLLPSLEKELGKDSKIINEVNETIDEIEKEFDNNNNKKSENKIRTENTKKYLSIVNKKKLLNDTTYFKEKLTLSEQSNILKELENVIKHCSIDKPYKLTLLETDIPSEYKAVAYKKINTLKNMEPGESGYYKIKQWVDTFMQIPFGKYKNLPITLLDDGPEKCADFMDSAKNTLDNAVYGMNDVKLQIMQLVGQWITNPSAMGTAIAIKGPMGTGKTTIVKEGISKVLGRDFAFLALGGATDSSFLEGHSYTYEGSTCGKIIDILVQSKSMNPVIFLDELDKVSDTPKGEEIIGILTHLIDTSQNSKFHDKYFAELDFDLSRVLFIFSYNDESKVNPILRDRMYRVQTKGYDTKEKIVIAEKYLLPKIREQVKFNNDDIIIPESTMNHIIENHTDKEQGVRNLKRCLEIIYTKLNLYRLMRPGTNLFEKEMALDVKFPMTITCDVVDVLIKTQKSVGSWQSMYI